MPCPTGRRRGILHTALTGHKVADTTADEMAYKMSRKRSVHVLLAGEAGQRRRQGRIIKGSTSDALTVAASKPWLTCPPAACTIFQTYWRVSA